MTDAQAIKTSAGQLAVANNLIIEFPSIFFREQPEIASAICPGRISGFSELFASANNTHANTYNCDMMNDDSINIYYLIIISYYHVVHVPLLQFISSSPLLGLEHSIFLVKLILFPFLFEFCNFCFDLKLSIFLLTKSHKIH